MILFLPPIVSLLFLLVFYISFVAIFLYFDWPRAVFISFGRDLLICSRPVPFSVVVMYKFLPAPNIEVCLSRCMKPQAHLSLCLDFFFFFFFFFLAATHACSPKACCTETCHYVRLVWQPIFFRVALCAFLFLAHQLE